MTANYIAVDWGSSNLRAWRWRDGRCVDRLDLPCGVTMLNGEAPAGAFHRLFDDWREAGKVPVIMAGMIGSNVGWHSVPYLPCPADLGELHRHLHYVAPNVAIVPGLQLRQEGRCDVMRGEETQLLGAMSEAPSPLYVLPGTHSKWVAADGQRVSGFSTSITGELHFLLMNHALIGRGLPPQRDDPEAFDAGLAAGIDQPAVLPQLFDIRASCLLGERDPTSASDWLSGLLIGAETAQLAARYRPRQITLIASSVLQQRYQRAFERLGVSVQPLPGERAMQTGIRKIIDEMAH